MDNWKSLFESHILRRGLDYFEQGWVGPVSKTESGYAAVVEGTEDYEVEIYVQKRGSANEVIHDMECTCPYAQDGNYCKHMAAVLYEIEENGSIPQSTITASYLTEGELLLKTLADMSEEQVREELLTLALADKAIAQRIITRYANTFDEKQLARLKEEIHEIAWENSDRDGFVDYWHASDYASEMMDFMGEHVANLIDRGALMYAFELVGEVFLTVATQDIDDSNGETTYLSEECQQYWQQIIDKANDEEQLRMYEWFKTQLNNPAVFDYMQDVLHEVMMTAFHSQDLLKLRLKQLDEMIAQAEQEQLGKVAHFLGYYFEGMVANRITTMVELGMPKDEVEAYQQKYWSLASVRRWAITAERNRNNPERAIEYLKQSKVIDQGNLKRLAEWSIQLTEIYRELGRKEDYKEEFTFWVMKTNAFDMENIKELKKLCSEEEWLKQRAELLSNDKYLSIRHDLMAEEKLYDWLLAELKQDPILYTLDQYEKVLKKHDPVQLRDLYVACIKQEADRANERKKYKGVIQYLKKIKRYPEGTEITKAIAGEWRSIYSRRSAMMDELRRAGF